MCLTYLRRRGSDSLWETFNWRLVAPTDFLCDVVDFTGHDAEAFDLGFTWNEPSLLRAWTNRTALSKRDG